MAVVMGASQRRQLSLCWVEPSGKRRCYEETSIKPQRRLEKWFRPLGVGFGYPLTRARRSLMRNTDSSLPRRLDSCFCRLGAVTLENTRTAAPSGAQEAVQREGPAWNPVHPTIHSD